MKWGACAAAFLVQRSVHILRVKLLNVRLTGIACSYNLQHLSPVRLFVLLQGSRVHPALPPAGVIIAAEVGSPGGILLCVILSGIALPRK